MNQALTPKPILLTLVVYLSWALALLEVSWVGSEARPFCALLPQGQQNGLQDGKVMPSHSSGGSRGRGLGNAVIPKEIK